MCGGPRAPVDESKGPQQGVVRLGDLDIDQPMPGSQHKAENVSLTRTLSGRKLYIVSSQVCLVLCDNFTFQCVCVCARARARVCCVPGRSEWRLSKRTLDCLDRLWLKVSHVGDECALCVGWWQSAYAQRQRRAHLQAGCNS